jgi:hypothetical protein
LIAAFAEAWIPGLFAQVSDLGWIREHWNVLITLPTGVGKSHLGAALAHLFNSSHQLYLRLARACSLGIAEEESFISACSAIGGPMSQPFEAAFAQDSTS